MSKEFSKELDIEKILDNMRNLRDIRNEKIVSDILINPAIDKQEEREKFLKSSKVIDVKYLGKIPFEEEIDGEKVKTEKDIYMLIEQKLDKKGNIIEIERFITEDGEFLAGNNRSDNYNVLMLLEKYKDREDLALSLQELDDKGILDLNEIENDRIVEIARTLGLSVEDVEALSEIDLQQEIEDRIEEKTEKGISLEKQARTEKDEDGKETLTKKQVDKISTKTEIETDEKVTDKETISQLFGVQDKKYKKIAVVCSSNLKDNKDNTRFSFVGIKEDGSAEKIDTLEQRYGKNPTKKIESINRDGSEIKEEQAQSIFQVKGRKEEQVAVRIGTMGTIETSLVRTPRQDNSKAISIPIATHNTKYTTRETRKLMNRHKNPSVKEETERIENHREIGDTDKDITLKDIDDNPYNDTHHHMKESNGRENTSLDYAVNEVLERKPELAYTYNKKDVMQFALKELNSRENP